MTLFNGKKGSGTSTLAYSLWQFTGSAMLNLFIFILLAAYLSPLVYVLATSVKGHAQLLDTKAPLYPAVNPQFNYKGINYSVMTVPTADGDKQWALVTPRRTYAEFIDPQDPGRGLIHWDGNWRALQKAYTFSANFSLFPEFWNGAKIPQAMANTLIIALITEIGVLFSSIAVAYGFSRFRLPGGKWLFLVLIATILIPGSITALPTYFMFVRVLQWNGSWLPLIVPHFFGSAIFIFLLRQNFKSIPRDLDEAAMIDGAGPLRILTAIIIPQSIPVITTVAMLHFFYIWNELHDATQYLSTRPDLRTISLTSPALNATTIGFTPEGLQAGAIVIMIVPLVVLFVFQRFFVQDIVVTGLEK
jgi:multiple sugar transport system permease protein